jgi:hypothetical protein
MRYSITSSARSNNEVGMVIPRVRAVLRLTLSSIFSDCCTIGKSAGLAPRKYSARIYPGLSQGIFKPSAVTD